MRFKAFFWSGRGGSFWCVCVRRQQAVTVGVVGGGRTGRKAGARGAFLHADETTAARSTRAAFASLLLFYRSWPLTSSLGAMLGRSGWSRGARVERGSAWRRARGRAHGETKSEVCSSLSLPVLFFGPPAAASDPHPTPPPDTASEPVCVCVCARTHPHARRVSPLPASLFPFPTKMPAVCSTAAAPAVAAPLAPRRPAPRPPRAGMRSPVALATPRPGGHQAPGRATTPASSPLIRLVASPAVSAPSASTAISTTPFPRGPHWEVHKFGGTCVSAAERIREAAAYILERHNGRTADGGATAVVVSAMGSHPTSPVKVRRDGEERQRESASWACLWGVWEGQLRGRRPGARPSLRCALG